MYSKPEGYSLSSPKSTKVSLMILMRTLPVVFEIGDEDFIESFFFKNQIVLKKELKKEEKTENKGEKDEKTKNEKEVKDEKANNENKEIEKKEDENATEEVIVIGNEELIKISEEKEEEKKENVFTFDRIGKVELKVSIAEVFITSMMRLLFIPGFTIPESQLVGQQKDKNDSLEQPLIWDGGIIVNKDNRAATSEIQTNRIDVIRCFLTLFSGTLFLQRKCLNNV
jgi:hypothetical protein